MVYVLQHSARLMAVITGRRVTQSHHKLATDRPDDTLPLQQLVTGLPIGQQQSALNSELAAYPSCVIV